MTEKLASATLRFQATEKIRASILSGLLKPGERLVERDFAAQLGTSLTVVREALVQLETEGFVTKRPNSATHITQLDSEDVKEILVVRRLLEGFAVEEAARLATEDRIVLLEKLHLDAAEAARTSNCQAYIQADLTWHDAVWQTTRNETLRAALKRLVLPLFGFSAIQVVSRAGFDLRQDAYSHLPVLEGIRKRDPAAARRAFNIAFDGWGAQLLESEPTASEERSEKQANVQGKPD